MPHVARYFSQQAYDSAFEPRLKKSKLDYSAVCKKKNIEDYIPLQSVEGSSSGFCGSHKGEREKSRATEGFLNGLDNKAKPGSSRNYQDQQGIEAQSRIESKLDYSKRDAEEHISLEAQAEIESSSGFSETIYYGSDKCVHEKPRGGEDFLNDLGSQEQPGSCSNYSFEAYGRRESKPDYSALSRKTNNKEYISLETQSKKWGSSGFSETRFYGSDKGEHEKPRVNENFLNGRDNESKPGPCRNNPSEARYSRREDGNKNQQILELPKTEKWKNTNSEAKFSETSTAFIGPLYQPPTQVESVSNATHNENSKSPSFRITTVVSGKAANRTKGEGGINYELRQFYKELYELEAAADDHNISQTTGDSQQNFSSQLSNAPTVHQVRDPHSQQSSSQTCNSLPIKPSAPIHPSYHPNEPPVSPAKRPMLPPINNQNFYDRPVPFDRTNSFVSQTLPPPGFQCPPPGFQCPPPDFQCVPPPPFVHYVPPPPRYNYPWIFPRKDNIQNSPYLENVKYHSVNGDHPRPTTQAPWHSAHIPPEKRFCPEGRGFTEPFPRSPIESSQQACEQEDFCEQKGRHFSEIRLQGGNVPHEQYPPRFSDEAKCTDFKRKLVLLRGVPGSGKSTLARTLLDQSPEGIVFSTDDYFCLENGYTYDVKLLGDAHSWNRDRARRAMDDGRSPIIIDNTNLQSWEMKPYVQMAIERGYGIEFIEPNTWWKQDPHELEKRNTHRVPREKISQMLERFEHDMNVGVVMNSVEPRRVRSGRPPPEARQRWGASVDCTPHSTSFQSR